MAEGRLRAEWDVASNILATLYNTRAFGAKQRVEPWQCNPFQSRKRKQTTPGDITCLKALLT